LILWWARQGSNL